MAYGLICLSDNYSARYANMEMTERAAAKLDYLLYAIDDETAIKVMDGRVEVVSQGE